MQILNERLNKSTWLWMREWYAYISSLIELVLQKKWVTSLFKWKEEVKKWVVSILKDY